MKIGKLVAACAVSASFGIALSIPTPFEATYKNHLEIQELRAQFYHHQVLDAAQRIVDMTFAKPNAKTILKLMEKDEEEYWMRILEHALSNPYMAKMAAEGIASKIEVSAKFNMKEDIRKWRERAARLQSLAEVKDKDALEWRTLYSDKEGNRKEP